MEAHQTSNLGVLGSSPRQDVRIFFKKLNIFITLKIIQKKRKKEKRL